MIQSNRSALVAFVASIMMLNFSPVAAAALVTYEFTGVVRSVQNQIGDAAANLAFLAGYGVEEGAPISGGYTIDTSGVDVDPSTTIGRYFDNPVSLHYQIGDVTLQIMPMQDGGRLLFVSNGSSQDRFQISSSIVPDQPGFRTAYFDLLLTSGRGGFLDDDGIPELLPDLADIVGFGFGTQLSGVFGIAGGGQALFNAELLTNRVVPLPAAFWLFASAGLALVRVARRAT